MVACEYGGNVGVPALFDRELFDELMGLEGDQGARAVLESGPDQVARIAWPAGAEDVDTPEDFAALAGGPEVADPEKDL